MDVLMPQLGETVKEGTISTWFKKAGDMVAAGDNLFEIETDKVSMEVQAIESGRLTEVFVQAGETAQVGAVVAVIGEGSGKRPAPKAAATSAPASPKTPAPAPRASAPVAAPSASTQGAPLASRGFAPFNEVFTPTRNFGAAKLPDNMRVSPLARRLAAQNGVDLPTLAARVRAEGRHKIAAADVQAAPRGVAANGVAASAPAPVFEITGARDVEPLNRIRKQTARHLQTSWQSVPHVTQAVEVDFGAVAAVRQAQKDAFRARHNIGLSYLPFIARAVCIGLRAFPRINAALDGDRLMIARAIHLGFAVDLGHEGLVVPVLRDADGYNVGGLALALNSLIEKARAGRLTPDDMSGATYSITNNGSFGTLFTTPLINPPQVAILSSDAIAKRPVVKETQWGDVIVARPVGLLAQSFDHRAFDGAYSAAFLAHVKTTIETRDWSAEF